MPSSFDCHDTASGFDCKIRINSFDAYGPPGSSGWVLEYSGENTFGLANNETDVVFYTDEGSVFRRASSGSWTKWTSGLDWNQQGFPTIAFNGSDCFVYGKTGGLGVVTQRVVYKVTATGHAASTANNSTATYKLGGLVNNGSALHWICHGLDPAFPYPDSSGQATTGGAWSSGTVTNLPSGYYTGGFISDAMLSGNIVSPYKSWAGTTTLSGTNFDSGSGFPARAHQIATWSGVAYAAQGGITSGAKIMAVSGIGSGWYTLANISGGGSDLGAAIASSGKIYLTIQVLSGATYILNILSYDIAGAAFTLEHTSINNGGNGGAWFTKTSSAIFVGVGRWVYRKDL